MNDKTLEINLIEEEIDDIPEYLKENYLSIYEAMINENYIIEYPFSEYLHIIEYDDKTVGFYTYNTMQTPTRITIEEFYIIPEYRGNNIFTDTLIDLEIQDNLDVLLRNPPRHVIKLLEKNELAYPLTKNLIYSYFKLATTIDETFINKKTKSLFEELEYPMNQMNPVGDVYDLSLSSIVYNDTVGITVEDDIICLSTPRKSDNRRYRLQKKLKQVDKKYLRKLYKQAMKNISKMEEYENIIKEKLEENVTVDSILGSADNLKDEITEYTEYNDITIEELKIIHQKTQMALDEGDINSEHIFTRFEYLVDYPEKEAVVTNLKDDGGCDYCGGLEFDEGICDNCGFNLFDKHLEKTKEEISNQADKETGLYYTLIDEIKENNLDINMIRQYQLEYLSIDFLNFIDHQGHYPSLPDFDDQHMISEEYYINYLQSHGLIELIENTERDDEKEFLDMLRSNGAIPTPRAYKAHIHRPYRYKITKKGRRYYKQNKLPNLYNSYIHKIPYYKFKLYQQEHESTDEMTLIKNFIEYNRQNAIKQSDLNAYCNILVSDILISKDEDDIKDILTKIMTSTMANLNRYKLLDEYSNDDRPISVENEIWIDQYREFIEYYDIDELLDNAYDSIELEELKGEKLGVFHDMKEALKEDRIFDANQNLTMKYNKKINNI